MAPLRTISNLSHDLIGEILKRIPVRDVIRCQAVCKPWLGIIQSEQFVISQLGHAVRDMRPLLTLISHAAWNDSYDDDDCDDDDDDDDNDNDDDDHMYSVSLLDVASPQIEYNLRLPYDPNRDFAPHYYFPCIIGSVNGIVCVNVNYTDANESCRVHIFLWNPASRRSKLIPCGVNVDGFNMQALGFGYDSLQGDYKVLRAVYPDNMVGMNSLYYEVYSDTRGDWRRVLDPVQRGLSISLNASVNGILCGAGGGLGLSAFNLNSEVLITAINLPVIPSVILPGNVLSDGIEITGIDDVQDPDFEVAMDLDQVQVTEFNNSVVVIMLSGSWKNIITWTLDNDECLGRAGVAANWTPIFSITLGMHADLGNGFFFNERFQVLLKINDVGMWLSCNVDNREAKIIQLLGDLADGHPSYFHMYTETLVSLPGFSPVPNY